MIRLGFFAFLLMLAGAARAADPAAGSRPPPEQSRTFSGEIRLGAFLHDPRSPERGAVDGNGEALVGLSLTGRQPVAALLIPRLHFGGTGSFAGKTSHLYSGLTWTFDLTPSVFVEGSFGAAIHNGKTSNVPIDRNAMGCSWGFRESASLGYRIDASWSVMATIEHISNSGSCRQNRGLTNFGLRLGYQF